MEGKIYSGFTGIGKSTAARKGHGIDLDCGGFGLDDDLYINIALKIIKYGKNVFISGFRRHREYMLKNNIPYIIVLPHISDKEIFKERLQKRGMSGKYADMVERIWGYDIYAFQGETAIYLPPNGFMSNIFEGEHHHE